MTKEEMINILGKAKEAFSKPPQHTLHNEYGLCYYLNLQGFRDKDIKQILGDKYSDFRYTLAPRTQMEIYHYLKYKHTYKYARRDWIRDRIKQLKMEIQQNETL